MENLRALRSSWSRKLLENRNICCGIKYSKAAKLICLVDIIIVISWIICILTHFVNWSTRSNKTRKVQLTFWSCFGVKLAINLCLAAFLFHAIRSKDFRKCRLWMVFATLLFCMTLLMLIIHLSISDSGRKSFIIIFVFYAFYRIYTLCIVYLAMADMQNHSSSHSTRKLTKRELTKFFNGDPGHVEGGLEVEHQPFNPEFEIPVEKLNLDTENPLENLEFGFVLKGNLRFPDGSYNLVSVVSTRNADLNYFKYLLSELKIMTYVSQEKHENCLQLIGAVTTNIRERELLTIYEYCSYGNLQNYLKTHRGCFTNLVKNGMISKDYAAKHYCNIQAIVTDEIITTFDLMKWSYEISLGLKYLESIGVVHADLCAKNIYLSADKVAKISSVGLPKKLFLYSTYDNSDETNLNWRWMAIESLRDVSFTSQSDVWGLGVIFWEIFTLGTLPFSGLSWTPDFVNYLAKGLRMNKPPYATDEIYKTILECWDNDPLQRPLLHAICDSFETVLRQYNILDHMSVQRSSCVVANGSANSQNSSNCIPDTGDNIL